MMKKSLHLISIRLLITIILCSLSKGVLAQDSTTETWEDLAEAPKDWNTNSKEINISSEKELAWVAKMVNNDEDTGESNKKGFEGVTINLKADLNLAGHLWISIGKDNLNDEFIKLFKGTFDGGNFTISNMTINTVYAAGLFGHIKNATIKNVTLTGCSIKKTVEPEIRDLRNLFIGCIAANSKSSTIQSCHVEGLIKRENSEGETIGGIIGLGQESIVTDCTFEGAITVHQSEDGRKAHQGSGWIGGIVGDHVNENNIGSITNCHATITMDLEGADAGGITSINRGYIKDCTAKGKIDLTADNYLYGLGGIAGQNTARTNGDYSIEGCNSSCELTLIYTANETKPSGWNRAIAGGIAGEHCSRTLPIIGCTASGTITTQLITDQPDRVDLNLFKSYAGGIVGYSESEIRDCKSFVNISASTTIPATPIYAGGIVGYTSSKPVTNCIASGNMILDGFAIYGGGIAGYNYSVITNCQTNISVSSNKSKSRYSATINGISAKGRTCYIGGVSGINYKTIKNSYSTANLTTESSSNNYIGSLVGYNYGKNPIWGEIVDCYATGNITSTGVGNRVGGIVGQNESKVQNCYTTSQLEAIRTEQNKGYVGGIVGINTATGSIENCLGLNISGITNYTTAIGRIIGYYYTGGTVTNNYAHTEIPGNWDINKTELNGSDWDNVQTYPFAASDAWDFTDNTQLPKLKKINDDGSSYSEMIANQPSIPLLNLQYFTITFNKPDNGTLTVNQENNTPISSGDKVLGGTKLTITAEASEGYQVNELLVNSTPFTSGDVLTVSSNIDIAVTITKKPEPTPDPDPDPTPKPDPDPTPTVYHIVTLPQIEGATTDPVAGEYEVEAWSSFRFYLTLDEAYSQSSPIVTTDRGETITPRSSDGAYIIKYVRQPITISIDGIIKNPDPVANETIDANSPKVWTKDSYLHLQTPQPETVFIYTFNGTLLKKLTNLSGNKTLWLPQGNYIVLIGKERFKVQVK